MFADESAELSSVDFNTSLGLIARCSKSSTPPADDDDTSRNISWFQLERFPEIAKDPHIRENFLSLFDLISASFEASSNLNRRTSFSSTFRRTDATVWHVLQEHSQRYKTPFPFSCSCFPAHIQGKPNFIWLPFWKFEYHAKQRKRGEVSAVFISVFCTARLWQISTAFTSTQLASGPKFCSYFLVYLLLYRLTHRSIAVSGCRDIASRRHIVLSVSQHSVRWFC